MDGSQNVIERNRVTCAHLHNLSFDTVHVAADLVQHQRFGALAQVHNKIIYSRFFLHAIDEAAQVGLLQAMSRVMHAGERAFLEFRCSQDEGLTKATPTHYRRYVDVAELLRQCGEHQFKLGYRVEGNGLAKYQSDDAFVCRLILIKI